MCWGLGVVLRVFANLAGRMCRDALDAAYQICTHCAKKNDPIQLKEFRRENENATDEQCYRNVSRESAELILASRQNGTFIVRPSQLRDTLGTLSVIQDDRVYHLTIRRRIQDGKIALGTPKDDERSFKDLNCLINYYVSNYLVLFSDNGTARTLLLPFYG